MIGRWFVLLLLLSIRSDHSIMRPGEDNALAHLKAAKAAPNRQLTPPSTSPALLDPSNFIGCSIVTV
jgi:hypothetical protein